VPPLAAAARRVRAHVRDEAAQRGGVRLQVSKGLIHRRLGYQRRGGERQVLKQQRAALQGDG
jgi:hypothetical protein